MSNSPFEQGLANAWDLTGAALRGARGPERKMAEAIFRDQGLPGRKHESWKYTDLEVLRRQAYTLRPPHEILSPEIKKLVADLSAPGELTLVFLDGHLHLAGESVSLPVGLQLKDLETLPEIPEVFARQGLIPDAGFQEVNRSLATSSQILTLEAGTHLSAPVHFIHLTTAGATPSMAHTRVLVQVGARSHLRLIQSHRVLPGVAATYATQSTQVVVETGGVLDLLDTGRGSTRHIAMEHVTVTQQKDSRVGLTYLRRGSRLGRTDIDVVLNGEGSRLELRALAQLNGEDHQDFHARVRHHSPRAESQSLFKGVLDGHSHGVFSGCVTVDEGAQGTQAGQAFRNLILSTNAKVDVAPQLEIHHDDVKCNHGATTGQLREDELFYLMSRGITKEEARAMLARGFLNDLIGQLREGRERALAEAFCAPEKNP